MSLDKAKALLIDTDSHFPNPDYLIGIGGFIVCLF
jgi:hypothetical protein